MTTEADNREERDLRKWAIEVVMGSSLRPGALPPGQGQADVVAVAQRIVDFVKGNGASKTSNGRGKRS